MPEDPALYWTLANRFGILTDEAAGAWNAGNVRDVLALADGTVVAASDTSGVWVLRGENTHRVIRGPVGRTRCLAQGPDHPQHVYVGGDGLFVTFDLRSWQQIPLPPGVGQVVGLDCTASTRRIMIASDAGLFFGDIPRDAMTGTYAWTRGSTMRTRSVVAWSDQPAWSPWRVLTASGDAAGFAGTGPLTAVTRFARHLDVFGVDPDGRVRTGYGPTQPVALDQWYSLHDDRLQPNSRVAALSRAADSLDAVAVAPDGSVRVSSWPSAPGGHGWTPWYTIGRPGVDRLDPRCPPCLVSRTHDTADVFGIGTNGAPYRCVRRTGTWTDWGSWSPVGNPGRRLDARAGLTAVTRARSPHLNRYGGPPVPTPDHRHLDVFAITEDGQVLTTWTDDTEAATWGSWYVVGNAAARLDPASGLAVLARRADHLDVFARGTDGRVYSSWWHEGGRWSDWFPVGGAVIESGTPMTAVAPQPEEIHLFVTGTDRQPWTAWWSGLGGWSAWSPQPAPEPLAARSRLEAIATHTDRILLLAHAASGAVMGCARRPTRDRVVASVPKGVGDAVTAPLLFGSIATGGAGPTLSLTAATVTGVRTADMGTTSHGMSAFAPERGFAVASGGTRGQILTALRTTDGGQSWTACPGTVLGAGPSGQSTLADESGEQGHDWNNCIATDPFTGTVAVIGWVKRFVTTDSGQTWRHLLPNSRHGHDDHHAVRFDLLDDTGRTVLIASDGGVVVTRDLGATFDSSWNRRLSNLQFYARNSRRQSSGGGATSMVEGLVAGGTQDNANLWCSVHPEPTPWRRIDSGDGGLCLFLRNGDLITSRPANAWQDLADYELARWDASARGFTRVGVVPVTRQKPGGPRLAGLYGAASAVNQPVDRGANRSMVYAVACVWPSADLYLGLAATDTQPFRWEYELTLPGFAAGEAINAVGSANSRIMFCGTNLGRIFRADTERHTAVEMRIDAPRSNRTITQFCVVDDDLVYALDPDRTDETGGVLKLTDGAWQPVAGLAPATYWGIDIDWTVRPATVFACDEDQVFLSRDDGRTWASASANLPPYPKLADLRFTLTPSGRKQLFLSTFGHSLWVSEVP